ncbi:protein EVI2A [Sminthopsis crassicaudata]|uniref:protein EVI2A n=1 Tax=Sminthopsis crassicaudata TaxID=9301 RepID=UPI003D69FCCC
MEPTGSYLHAALLTTTIFSWLPQTKANTTSLWVINSTDWDPIFQNKTTGSEGGGSVNPGAPEKAVVSTASPPALRSPSPHSLSFAPPPGRDLHTPSPPGVSSTAPKQSTRRPGDGQDDVFKRDICEEGNNKMAMLVCLIIIAVLFLICTLLFLSTVILANRVSSLKRAKPVCKRQTRSNGDFLASSGLWPADSDTGKRSQQLTGTRLMLQATGTLPLPRERKDIGATEKLTL